MTGSMSEEHPEESPQLVELPALPEQEFVREAEVLSWLKVGRTTLWRWIRRCGFPSPVKLCGRTNRWRVEDLKRWARERSYVVAASSLESKGSQETTNE